MSPEPRGELIRLQLPSLPVQRLLLLDGDDDPLGRGRLSVADVVAKTGDEHQRPLLSCCCYGPAAGGFDRVAGLPRLGGN